MNPARSELLPAVHRQRPQPKKILFNEYQSIYIGSPFLQPVATRCVRSVAEAVHHSIVEARELEHGFRRNNARILYTLPQGHEDSDVPTFWILL